MTSRFTRRACYKVSPAGPASGSGSSSSSRAVTTPAAAWPAGHRDQELGQVLAVGGPGSQTAEAHLGAGRQEHRRQPHHRLPRPTAGGPRSWPPR